MSKSKKSKPRKKTNQIKLHKLPDGCPVCGTLSSPHFCTGKSKQTFEFHWKADPSKIKIGKGKNAITLEKYFENEVRKFAYSFTDMASVRQK